MKRSRAATDELSEDTKLKILNDEQIKLGAPFTGNTVNVNPPGLTTALAVDASGFFRLSPGLITDGDQTFTGTKNFVPGIKLNGGTLLGTYLVTSGSTVPVLVVGTITTLEVRGAPATTIPWKVVRIGDIVTLSVAEFRVTASVGVGNSQVHLNNLLPAGFRPVSGDLRGAVPLLDAGTPAAGCPQYDIDTAGSVAFIWPDAAPAVPYGTFSDFSCSFVASSFV